MGAGMPMPGGWTMSMAWMRMPGQSWLGAAVMFVAMWAVMMIAMMLPSVVPVLLHHRRPLRVACGYFAVWTSVGVAIYPLGIALAAIEMRSAAVAREVPIAIGFAIVLAGVVQLTRWKLRELARCRDRACCAIGRRPGPRQAWLDGLRLGRHCAACCAPPIAVMLVAGVMDLRAMAIVACAITAERLAPWPRVVARAIGVCMLVIGGVAIAIAP
jgi:predicted metal-binding membrane protein